MSNSIFPKVIRLHNEFSPSQLLVVFDYFLMSIKFDLITIDFDNHQLIDNTSNLLPFRKKTRITVLFVVT